VKFEFIILARRNEISLREGMMEGWREDVNADIKKWQKSQQTNIPKTYCCHSK
jgi:hypothetical protein